VCTRVHASARVCTRKWVPARAHACCRLQHLSKHAAGKRKLPAHVVGLRHIGREIGKSARVRRLRLAEDAWGF